jgi:hypothetical protein
MSWLADTGSLLGFDCAEIPKRIRKTAPLAFAQGNGDLKIQQIQNLSPERRRRTEPSPTALTRHQPTGAKAISAPAYEKTIKRATKPA